MDKIGQYMFVSRMKRVEAVPTDQATARMRGRSKVEPKGGIQMYRLSFHRFPGFRRCATTVGIFGTIACTIALGGCSKDLSRGRAATLIANQKKVMSTSDAKVVVGRFSYDWRNVNNDFPFQALAAVGILSIREGRSQGIWWKEYLVELTAAGQREATNWVKTTEEVQSFLGPASKGATVYRIPLASKKLLEVTGIVTDPSGRAAEIEFKWKWVPTSQAKLLPAQVPSGEVRQESAVAQLYDDGWRIIRVGSKEISNE